MITKNQQTLCTELNATPINDPARSVARIFIGCFHRQYLRNRTWIPQTRQHPNWETFKLQAKFDSIEITGSGNITELPYSVSIQGDLVRLSHLF